MGLEEGSPTVGLYRGHIWRYDQFGGGFLVAMSSTSMARYVRVGVSSFSVFRRRSVCEGPNCGLDIRVSS